MWIVDVINMLLTMALCIIMVTTMMDQRKKIAALEARITNGGYGPTIIDGEHRMLARRVGYVDDTGAVSVLTQSGTTSKTMNLPPEFAGMAVEVYVVASVD